MIFGRFRPQLAIITTPNRDFNVFFPNLCGRLRNIDHRFEWSREEFHTWAQEVARKFDYGVTFDGVGLPRTGDSTKGFCTQVAVFRRQFEFVSHRIRPMTFQEPRLVDLVKYPHVDSSMRSSQNIRQVIAHYMREFVAQRFDEGDDDDFEWRWTFDTDYLFGFSSIVSLCGTRARLASILAEATDICVSLGNGKYRVAQEFLSATYLEQDSGAEDALNDHHGSQPGSDLGGAFDDDNFGYNSRYYQDEEW